MDDYSDQWSLTHLQLNTDFIFPPVSAVTLFPPSLSCINTKLTQIGEQFCGLDVNTPLGGELPITAAPVNISLSLSRIW